MNSIFFNDGSDGIISDVKLEIQEAVESEVLDNANTLGETVSASKIKTLQEDNNEIQYTNETNQDVCGIKHEKDDIKHEIIDPELGQNHECSVCFKVFPHQNLVEVHKYIHNSKADNCPVCPKKYSKSLSRFQAHIEHHMKKAQICEFCNLLFFNGNEYRMHMHQHNINEKPFKCLLCEKTFCKKSALDVHQRVHTNERPYECEKCGKSFKQLGSFRSHDMIAHTEDKKFKCELCDGTFSTKSSLKRHEKRIHESGRCLICKLCGEEFLNKDNYFKHRMEKHSHTGKFIRFCLICNETFMCKSAFGEHKKAHRENDKNEEVFTTVSQLKREDYVVEEDLLNHLKNCTLCVKPIQLELFDSHVAEHLKMSIEEMEECEKSRRFPCKDCTKILPTKREALLHIDYKHLERIANCQVKGCKTSIRYIEGMTHVAYKRHYHQYHKAVICKHCKTQLKGLKLFQIHLDKCPNRAKKGKSFTCKWCKCTFSSASSLLQHSSIHKRIYAPTCRQCDKAFPIMTAYRKHMRVVHPDQEFKINVTTRSNVGSHTRRTRKKKLVCVLCQKSFISRILFDQHTRSHFENNVWRCKKCKKAFKTKRKYEQHVKLKICTVLLIEALLVKEGNTFECPVCLKTCPDSYRFAEHTLTAHKNHFANYPCQYCPAKLSSPWDLRTHLVGKHPTERKYFCSCRESNGFVKFSTYLSHRHFRCKNRWKKNVTGDSKFAVKEEVLYKSELVDVPEKVIVREDGTIEVI